MHSLIASFYSLALSSEVSIEMVCSDEETPLVSKKKASMESSKCMHSNLKKKSKYVLISLVLFVKSKILAL